MSDIAAKVRAGSRRAVARLLTAVENNHDGVEDVLSELFPFTGNARIIGVTGAPGTGKSTLVNMLAQKYRSDGRTVAVLAVDPTSPFSGGAILGDRIRMRDLSGDKGVFIRSMATRGSLGGLARATRDAIRVVDAAGFDIVLVETVGAGQSEVDIVRTAQTTVVVEAPGLGDDVQAIKAGILEIADVLVVNKADRMGAENTLRALKAMLELGHPTSDRQATMHHGQLLNIDASAPQIPTSGSVWIPPIVQTVATTGRGIDQLTTHIQAHYDHLQEHAQFTDEENQRVQIELYERLRETLVERFIASVHRDVFIDVIARVSRRELDPQHAIGLLLERAKRSET